MKSILIIAPSRGNKMMMLLLATTMVVSLAGCGAKKEEAAAGGKKWVIATDTAFKPFEYKAEDGNYVGIDIDILDAIAKDAVDTIVGRTARPMRLIQAIAPSSPDMSSVPESEHLVRKTTVPISRA